MTEKSDHGDYGAKRFRFDWGWAAWIVLALTIVEILTPAVRSRPASPATMRRGNLKQIYSVLQGYEKAHGTLPPPWSDLPQGQRGASWRTVILKYIGYQSLASLYAFQEPWNSDANRRLGQQVHAPLPYCDPSTRTEEPWTHVLAVTGPDTAWPLSGKQSLMNLGGKAPHLVLAVYVARSDVHWMEPRDLDVRDFKTASLESEPKTAVERLVFQTVLFADGEVWALDGRCPPAVLAKFFSIEGARSHDRESLLSPYRRG